MRLALCSSAAPDATLSGLFEACARRGLAALELREGDAHGLNPECEEIADCLASGSARIVGVPIVGYRTLRPGHDLWLGRLSRALGVPILLDAPTSVRSRLDRAAGISEVAGRVAIVVRGEDSLSDAEVAASEGVDLAWDADPAQGNLGDRVGRLLDRFGGRLRYVRLLGGGPEATLHGGEGIGDVMGRLALSGYAGTVALAPSSDRYRVAWQTWLGRRGGRGCGSRVSDPSPVQLSSDSGMGGGR